MAGLARKVKAVLSITATLPLMVDLVFILLCLPIATLYTLHHGFPGGPALSINNWTDPELHGAGMYAAVGLLILAVNLAFAILANGGDHYLDAADQRMLRVQTGQHDSGDQQ